MFLPGQSPVVSGPDCASRCRGFGKKNVFFSRQDPSRWAYVSPGFPIPVLTARLPLCISLPPFAAEPWQLAFFSGRMLSWTMWFNLPQVQNPLFPSTLVLHCPPFLAWDRTLLAVWPQSGSTWLEGWKLRLNILWLIFRLSSIYVLHLLTFSRAFFRLQEQKKKKKKKRKTDRYNRCLCSFGAWPQMMKIVISK